MTAPKYFSFCWATNLYLRVDCASWYCREFGTRKLMFQLRKTGRPEQHTACKIVGCCTLLTLLWRLHSRAEAAARFKIKLPC